MWMFCLLLTSGIFIGVCEGHKSDFVTFLVNKVEECFQTRGMAAVPCMKLGYDLLYENSTYSLRGDRSVQRTAHCAIEGCAEGIKNGHKTGYFQGCLNGVKACVKRRKEEL